MRLTQEQADLVYQYVIKYDQFEYDDEKDTSEPEEYFKQLGLHEDEEFNDISLDATGCVQMQPEDVTAEARVKLRRWLNERISG